MIPPTPTTAIDPTFARGIYSGEVTATATRPGFIKMKFANNYELHLFPEEPVTTVVGKRLVGRIYSEARRIDETKTGGRFVEPVFGRPRRIQGIIIAVYPKDNIIVVNAGMPIHVTPIDSRQNAADFQVGQFVGFDVPAGSTFLQSHS